MKKLLHVLFFFLLLPASVMAQKRSTKSYTSSFQQEGLIQTLQQLRQLGVDSIMVFLYDYDNGTVENSVSYVVWMNKGRGSVRIVRDYTGASATTRTNPGVDSLFAYYTQSKLWELPELQRCNESHDMGYYIAVYLPNKIAHYNVRDCQRYRLKQVDSSLPGEEHIQLTEDSRSLLIDMFERIVK